LVSEQSSVKETSITSILATFRYNDIAYTKFFSYSIQLIYLIRELWKKILNVNKEYVLTHGLSKISWKNNFLPSTFISQHRRYLAASSN